MQVPCARSIVAITDANAHRRRHLAWIIAATVGAVFGLLVGFAVGLVVALWMSGGAASKVSQASVQLSGVRLGLEMFYADTGRFPTVGEGLQVITQPVARGPYVKPAEMIDPWGRPLIYRYSGTGVPDVVTLGADGLPGGANANADLFTRPWIGPSTLPPAFKQATSQAAPAASSP